MCKFPHLFEPLKLNDKYTMRNRICSAPMAFALIACNPEANEKSFRKLEAPARGGDAIVCVGELKDERVDGYTDIIVTYQTQMALKGLTAEELDKLFAVLRDEILPRAR